MEQKIKVNCSIDNGVGGGEGMAKREAYFLLFLFVSEKAMLEKKELFQTKNFPFFSVLVGEVGLL